MTLRCKGTGFYRGINNPPAPRHELSKHLTMVCSPRPCYESYGLMLFYRSFRCAESSNCAWGYLHQTGVSVSLLQHPDSLPPGERPQLPYDSHDCHTVEAPNLGPAYFGALPPRKVNASQHTQIYTQICLMPPLLLLGTLPLELLLGRRRWREYLTEQVKVPDGGDDSDAAYE